MKRIHLILALLLVSVSFAQAQAPTPLCIPNNQGQGCITVDTNNPLPVTNSGSGGTVDVNLTEIAGAAPSATNPLWVSPATASTPWIVGGAAVYNTTLPTYTNGQRGDLQIGTRGSLNVTIFSADSATSAAVGTNSSDGISGAGNGLNVRSVPYVYNGTNFDRQFTCTNTAVVNVTSGNTTELVPLTASQTIRVCSFALTMSLAGTAQFVYGTGTNCGTSQQNITGAMTLGTTTPMTLSAGNGSVFRTAAGNALCLAAVTGNVTGFVTYAKYQ